MLSAYWIGGRLVTSDYRGEGLAGTGSSCMGRPDTSAYVALFGRVGVDEKSAADEQLEAFQQANE